MLSWFRRVAWYFGRRRYEEELAEELRTHRAMAAEDLERDGVTPPEARGRAQRRLGNDAALRERSRSVWTIGWVEGLLHDLRFAARALARRPGFASASVLTLALGLGATTALWSVLDPVLLRPLPYPNADRLVALREVKAAKPEGQSILSPANALFWRDRGRVLADLALYTWTNITLADEPAERLNGMRISTNLLSVLGSAPALGRSFAPEDTVPNAPLALLLSHEVWVRRFHADSAIVGKSVRTRESPAVIIGVMPAGFRPLAGEDYWVPFPIGASARVPRGRFVMAIGRLVKAEDLDPANLELRSIARGLEREFPEFDTGWSVRALPLREEVTGNARTVLWLLGGAIGFVLLVACANVANLHLGQAIARRGELALRSALGASRGQVLRQWLVEGLLLAFLGGAIGVVLAAVLVRVLTASGISQIPRLEEVRIDLRVLGVAVLLTTLAGLGFGLAPAVVVREGRLRGVLTGHGGTDPNPRARALRNGLVAAQVALCFTLLIGAGLAIRSLRQVLRQDPGIDPRGVLTFAISLPGRDYPALEQRQAFFHELTRRIHDLPGVKQVGLGAFLPLRAIMPATSFEIVGDPTPAPGQVPVTEVNEVDSEYFAAMGIPLIQGRPFDSRDRRGGNRVAMVNRALALMLGGPASAIGRQLKVAWSEPDSAYTVVGVVGDVRTVSLDAQARPLVYLSADQESSANGFTVVVRSDGRPGALVPALTTMVAELDPGLPLLNVASMEDRIRTSLAGRRYPMALLTLLGVLGLTLATVGLYGVLSYSVAQRQRELGVRRAIGATDSNVLGLVFRSGLGVIAIGLGIGAVGALVTSQLLRGLLFEISPTDPLTILATAGLVILVSLCACWIPARRAARIDPVQVLRGE